MGLIYKQGELKYAVEQLWLLNVEI